MTGLTTKGSYGITIILELSKYYNKKLLQISEISQKNDIPKSYLIQLLNKLKNSGLIDSIRGNKGGYKLSKSPDEITLKEVIEKLEGTIELFRQYDDEDIVRKIFNNVEKTLKEELKVTFTELLLRQEEDYKNSMYYI